MIPWLVIFMSAFPAHAQEVTVPVTVYVYNAHYLATTGDTRDNHGMVYQIVDGTIAY